MVTSRHYPLESKHYSEITIPGGCQVPLPGGNTDEASVAGLGQYRRNAR